MGNGGTTPPPGTPAAPRTAHTRSCSRLHTDEAASYRNRLTPHLASIELPWAQNDDDLRFQLPAFWYARRRAPVEPVTAVVRNPMSSLKGCWFPCDGAIALDASALPVACHRQLPDLFRALLLDLPDLMERWRARAEYCFLLRLLPPTDDTLSSIAIRETSFRNRQASLVDMQLPISQKLTERITA